MHASGVTAEGTFTPVQLFASEHAWPPICRKVTIAAGSGTLAAGTVLGKITSGGKFVKSLSASSDGSQTPTAILADPVTADGSDAEAMAYFTGHFRSAALTFGTSHTAASTAAGLRALGIHLD